MRTLVRQLPLALVALVAFVFAGCGGGHPYKTVAGGQRVYSGDRPHSPTFGLPPKGVKLPKRLARTAVPTVEQYDSVDTSTVPPCGQGCAVAGYEGGSWPTYDPLVRQFPNAYHLAIAVNAGEAFTFSHAPLQCLDVEPGDASPSQAPGWVQWLHRLGIVRPCLYSSLSEMGSVESYLNGAGLARSSYTLWDADWTYSAHLDSGFDCTQWTDHSLGRNLDESTCAVSFYGPPPRPPAPAWQIPGCYKLPPPDTNFCFGQGYGLHAHDAKWRPQELNYTLRMTGWLPADHKVSVVDHESFLAVKAYQARHNVGQRGTVDHATSALLARTLYQCRKHHVRDTGAPYPGVGT